LADMGASGGPGEGQEGGGGPGRAVVLQDLTWPQIERLVLRGARLCLLPVGATEQHGRHLPTSTDTTIATALCLEVSAQTGIALLPTLCYTSSQGHTTKWPGTFSLSPTALVDSVVGLSRWVRASGFTKLLMVNAHGGNIGALRVAVDEIRVAGGLQVGLVNWFDLTPSIAAIVNSDGDDVHANDAETSLMLHLQPELVDRSAIADDPDRTIGRVFTYTVAETSREGLTGRPSQASAEKGARLFDEVVEALAARVELARGEEPPTLD
jgi:creatinine amidohydrolase